MTDPTERRDVDTSVWVRTTTERDINYDDDSRLIRARHVLLLDTITNGIADVEVATMESFTVDPVADPEWVVTMDDYSQELCQIAELLLTSHPYDDLVTQTQPDARHRGADNGRFVVLSALWTDPTHRGHGYGMSLLHEVIRTSLRTAAFVIGEIECANKESSVARHGSCALTELIRQRTRSRELEANILMVP